MQGQVTRSGQVTIPYKNFTIAPLLYSVWGKVMKLSEYDKVIGTYKMYISDFYIGDLRSGHFRDLPIIGKSMGKN